jgi:hypothetical protein
VSYLRLEERELGWAGTKRERVARTGLAERRCPLFSALGSSTVDTDVRALKERVAEITDLYSSLWLLDWDQKVTCRPEATRPAPRHSRRSAY